MESSSSLSISHLFYLLLLLLLFNNIPHSHSFNIKCHDEERNALLEFKASFYKKPCDWPDCLSTWTGEGKSGDCCNWGGVQCDKHSGHVIDLHLRGSCLSGSINSSSSIFKLSHLQSLDLSYNDFRYSNIPSAISNLSRLERLAIISSNFSGQIPSGFLNLNNLSYLYLAYNDGLTLKNPSLRDLMQTLVKLESLDLSYLEISSSFPDSLSRLTSLRHLNLRGCKLQGQVPPSIANLTKLEKLYLKSNQLTGEIFPHLVTLTKLWYVDLSLNKFSGQIPRTISNLKNLTDLYLNSNNFSGEIHLDPFFQLDGLFELDLSYNNFSVIDSSIKLRSNLGYLYLASCNLRSFPLLLQSLDGLQHVDLSCNDISGEVPQWLLDNSMGNLLSLNLSHNRLTGFEWNLQSLKGAKFSDLDLSFNQLSGNIPAWICNLDNLMTLDLRNNSLIGMIPQCLIGTDGAKFLYKLHLSHNHLSTIEGNLPLLKWSLEYLDLSFNQLKGSPPIPSTGSLLEFYVVSNNQFFGELPTRMCDLFSLRVFDISYNNLSGVIPQCLANLFGIGNLSVLNLHHNDFSGPIPQLGKTGCNLTMIDVGYNQLEGRVPRDLKNCPSLEFLNLENNKIDDVFPFWLGKLPSLSILILHSNRFYGSIGKPSSGYEFPKLQIIDLSNNSFIGYLPVRYFDGWNAMKVDAHKEDRVVSYASYGSSSYFYTIAMTNKGTYREYTKIPKSLMGVDLSSNHFIGPIPKSIAILKGLRFLHISNNMLTEAIPSNLNGLTNLESLDLSNNKLYGEIPQQLTDLTTLEFFDVSFNQLRGLIPQSNQFSTFGSSSYQGNRDLCGPPLVRKCGNIFEASLPPSLEKNHALRTWIEIDWKIVSMGYTSGFFIGVVMGMNWIRGFKRVKRVHQIKFILN